MKKTFSIVSVADTKIKETLKALRFSKESLNSENALLITSRKIDPKLQFAGLEVVNVPPIKSFKEYNNFIIFELFKYINSTHALIVQWDGYVINPNKWDKKFLNYDYIGAPFIPRSQDKKYGKTGEGDFYTIGNGGFSLRSLNLLKSAIEFDLKDNINITNNHEDGFFCVLHRKFLEEKGLLWAPFEVASEFAIESPICFQDFFNLPLGFHGKKMLLISKIIKSFKALISGFF